jgi:hypothetical protein
MAVKSHLINLQHPQSGIVRGVNTFAATPLSVGTILFDAKP